MQRALLLHSLVQKNQRFDFKCNRQKVSVTLNGCMLQARGYGGGADAVV